MVKQVCGCDQAANFQSMLAFGLTKECIPRYLGGARRTNGGKRPVRHSVLFCSTQFFYEYSTELGTRREAESSSAGHVQRRAPNSPNGELPATDLENNKAK